MFSLRDKLPAWFREKFQLTATVTFTAFAGLAFLLILTHFSKSIWMSIAETTVFVVAVCFYLISLIALSVSRRLMYLSREKVDMTYLHYLLWCLAEAVLVTCIYMTVTYLSVYKGLIPPVEEAPASIFFNTLALVIFGLGIPYLICGMYFALEDKNNTIRLMNYGSVVSDEEIPSYNEQKITLFDSSGMMKMSVGIMNLYYIESDDNYIKVWYTDSSGALKQYMLRCRLKTVEESFRDSPLVRCHRKYIVNMLHAKVLSREKDGYFLTLDAEGSSPIPVSKTYEEAVLNIFNDRKA